MKKLMRNFVIASAILCGVAISSTGCNSSVDNSRLVIGMECNYAPFNWTQYQANDFTLPVDGKSGQYADGYDIAIAKLLSEDLGKEVVIRKTVWDSLTVDLSGGTINCIIAGMTDTEERQKQIDFTNEYYRSELVFVTKLANVPAGNSDESPVSKDDFRTFVNGQIIESQQGTVTDTMISDVFVSYGARHANAVDSFGTAANDVKNGNAFAMTAELPVAKSIVAANSTTLGLVHIDQTILGDKQAELGVSIGIKKGNIELQEALNASLAKITTEKRLELMTSAIDRSVNASE